VTVQLMHLLVVEPYQVVVLRVAMVALALVAVVATSTSVMKPLPKEAGPHAGPQVGKPS